MPDPTDLPKGCKFAPRCGKCMEICRNTQPGVFEENGHQIRCHLMTGGEKTGTQRQAEFPGENTSEVKK